MEEKSTGRGFLILSVASILGKLLSMVYAIILVNILGDEGQGLHATAYSVYVFLLAVTSMGAQPAITKVVTELRAIGNHEDAYRAMQITRRYLGIFGALISLLLLAFAQPIADSVKASGAVYGLMALAPAVFFVSILTVDRAYLQSVEDMKSLAVTQILEQFITIIINIVFAAILVKQSIAYGVAGGTIGATVGALITLAYTVFVFKKHKFKEEAQSHEKPKKRVSDKKILNRLFKYGLPIVMVAALQNSGTLIDAMNVKSRLMFSGLTEQMANAQFGILNRYTTLLYVPLAIVTALSMATFPKIIQAFAQRSKKDLKVHMSYAFRITYIITIPAAIALSILSKEVYMALFGKSLGSELLMYGAIVLVFMSVVQIQNTVLQGVNKLYVVLGTAGLGLLIKFVLNYVLVSITSLGILGVVISNFFAFGIPMVINHRMMQKTFRMKMPILRQSIVPILCSVVMGIALFLMQYPTERIANILGGGRLAYMLLLVPLVIIGGLIYFILMIYTGGIRRKDLNSISPKLFTMLPKFLRKQII